MSIHAILVLAMASQRPPPARTQPPAAAAITSLGDDLLCEIFLRLPALPSLVRSALACRTFLAAIRGSPAFRRRFRALHQPPLLGFFSESYGLGIPSFAPLRRQSDRDLTAAVRGADFFLTRVPDCDDASPGWEIRDCRGGYLLLVSWDAEQIAAYNPLTRALDLIPFPPDEIEDGGDDVEFAYHGFHILTSDEAPGSFRVISLCRDASRVRVAVFSSGTREWRVLPWEEPVPAQPAEDQQWLVNGTQSNGSLRWAHAKQAYQLVMDTATMQFSCIHLPHFWKGQSHLYKTGETKDGRPCVVCAIGFHVGVLYWRAGDDGVEKWVIDSVIPLLEEVLHATGGTHEDHGELKVWAIVDGLVFMSTSESMRDAGVPCWLLSFCLETRKLEKVFRRRMDDGNVHPYLMAWPPSLVK